MPHIILINGLEQISGFSESQLNLFIQKPKVWNKDANIDGVDVACTGCATVMVTIISVILVTYSLFSPWI